jgi:hypothetical protein
VNARRARERNRAERERLRAILDDAATAEPRYMRTLSNGQEVWLRSRMMLVIPALADDYPDPIKDAIDRRRRASLTGRCDCGALWNITRRGHLDMEHEPDCGASDAALDDLAAAHGMVFARWVA